MPVFAPGSLCTDVRNVTTKRRLLVFMIKLSINNIYRAKSRLVNRGAKSVLSAA